MILAFLSIVYTKDSANVNYRWIMVLGYKRRSHLIRRMSVLSIALWILVSFSSFQAVAPSDNDEQPLPPTLPIRLHDGNLLPRVGLGVALTGDKTYEAVTHAIQLGYSLFDTAAEESYGNEDQVGRAINEYYQANTVDFRKLFVTTKLWDTDHGFYSTLRACWDSYRNINKFSPQYSSIPIDLYLIHSPYGGRLLETWDALLWLQKQGLVQAIGVSNFGIEHLEVLRLANRPMPAVNQIEMHPLVYEQRRDLLEYCQRHSIVVQAFGSLMHGYPRFLEHPPPFLAKMVQSYRTNGIRYATYPQQTNENTEHNITVANILLQWATQHEFAVIPKSSKTHRITENVRYWNLLDEEEPVDGSTFALSQEDMELLDEWGSHLPYEDRNIYKEDWNWNPIDEAPLHIGKDDYWPSYKGMVELDRSSDLDGFFESLLEHNDLLDEDEYWEEYWENAVPLSDDDDDEYHGEQDDDESFHEEL